MTLPASSRELTDDDWQLVELARSTIDANTDADPDQDGVHTMGAAVRAADGLSVSTRVGPTLAV